MRIRVIGVEVLKNRTEAIDQEIKRPKMVEQSQKTNAQNKNTPKEKRVDIPTELVIPL